jgi:hypothetical protein
MFNGMITMTYSPSGWQVTQVYDGYVKYYRHIAVVRGSLILTGDFVIKPKLGFSKPPRALIGV